MADPVLAGLLTLATVALAETGDKTQLTLIVLATRMSPFRLWIGSVIGFGAVTALGVAAGGLAGATLSATVVRISAAVAMGLFGAWLLWRARHEAEEEEPPAWIQRHATWGPTVAGGAVGFLLEMGDKTQLAVVAYAARFDQPVAVLLGAWVALSALAAVAVAAGAWIKGRVHARTMQIVSGLLFLLMGALIAWLP